MANNIDKSTTLEQLENDYWQKPEYDSRLVQRTHALRKKPIKDFTVEDLRLMIGQNIGLEYLIPIAISILEKDFLAEGDFYKGDLLKAVLSSEETYWKKNKELWQKTVGIYEQQEDTIGQIDYSDIEEKIKAAFKHYRRIN